MADDGALVSDPLWYKDAVIYELHVKTFHDSDGDGIGDFRGLIEKLDYLQELGATALWLLPFYPSPLRDDGYDIADYFDVNPTYGTLSDFKAFLAAAHERGLRVITELVINHTSDQNPWFQKSRRAAAGSPEREFYVWSDSPEKYKDARIIFKDFETSNWSWDPVAKAYYWHRFYSHQPDLNFDNPAVHEVVQKVLDFWLGMGVDGLRLDAVPYLYEREGTNCENLPETHDYLKKLRAQMEAKFPGRMLLAEANQWPEDAVKYFGEGDESHMNFHFPLMPRMFMALQMEDRFPIIDILEQTPAIPDSCQWAMFLRNHDELTLEMVTDDERDYMYREYAQDPRMRINLGIRRRLAPLMDNDRRKIELLNSILFTMPGSPIIYYGDEIGMGDNVWLGDRDGVRTPMQWTPDRNAGFSRAEAARLYLPAIADSVYGYPAINVEAQQKSPFSLLNWTRRLIRVRKQHHAFGRGSITFLEPENPHVLAYIREWNDDAILVVNNLSGAAQAVRLDLTRFAGRVPVELLGETEFLPIDQTPYALTLSPYGFFWFALRTPRREDDLELHPEVAHEWAAQDAEVMESTASVSGIVDALPHDWLLRQRWFRGKAREISRVELAGHAVMRPERAPNVLVARIRVHYREGEPDTYLLPMSLRGLHAPGQTSEPILSHATERGDVRVYDALLDRRVAGALLDLVLNERTIGGTGGRYCGCATREAGDRTVRGPARPMGAEQSNTSVVFGDQYVMKVFRKLEAGTNPDLEITRFLVEQAGFRSVPALAGYIEFEGADGSKSSAAGLYRFVANKGDAWSVALRAMERFLGAASRSAADPETPTGRDALYRMAGDFFPAVRRLGETTARMHRALATETDDPAFRAEPVGHDDVRRWADGFRRQVDGVLGDLSRRLDSMPGFFPRDQHARLQQVVRAANDLRLRGEELEALADAGSVKVRIHGDYHLGQVLRGEHPAPDGNEWYVIDFEGEPARPIDERKAKYSVLRDVAGMLRSFDYAVRMALGEWKSDSLATQMQVERWADAWRAEVRSLFVSAYREALGESPVVPGDVNTMLRALSVFELEKAVYELGYEMNNRPDWIRVPLEGVLSLLGANQP